MKNQTKLFALAGIPVAIIGLTAASIAFADSTVPSAPAAPTQVTSTVSNSTDTDTETNDDAKVSTSASSSESDSDVETNGDATGAQEAPGTEQAD